MTREESKAAAAVMLAYADGKEIEYRYDGCGNWEQTVPRWDWIRFSYRVKPTPREIWVNFYRDGNSAYGTKVLAENNALADCTAVAVHFREVL